MGSIQKERLDADAGGRAAAAGGGGGVYFYYGCLGAPLLRLRAAYQIGASQKHELIIDTGR